MDRKNLPYFYLAVTLCSFLITSEYSLTRPASSSFFLRHFSASFLPYAWLVTVPINLLMISLYNRFLPKYGPFRLFLFTSFTTIGISLASGLWIKENPYLSFAHYVWKDIYILLMFKQLWSMIHSSIDTKKNKMVYSLLFGIGGVGSVIGSLITSYAAVKIGSSRFFFFTTPLYLLLIISYWTAKRKAGSFTFSAARSSSWTGFSLVKQSKYLTFLLLLVVFMQMAVALTDYQFNSLLEQKIQLTDLRAEYYGKIMSIVNSTSLLFQLIGSITIVKLMGVRRSHLFVPISLGCNALLFLLFPSFGLISFGFATIKVFDFSFFSVIREMLYSPLNGEEKYHAKSVIDVFAYRSAKAIASLFIIFLPSFFPASSLLFSSIFLLGIFTLWLFVLPSLFKQEKAKVLLH